MGEFLRFIFGPGCAQNNRIADFVTTFEARGLRLVPPAGRWPDVEFPGAPLLGMPPRARFLFIELGPTAWASTSVALATMGGWLPEPAPKASSRLFI